MDPKSFPPSLKTKTKRTQRARMLIEEFHGVKTKSARFAGFQGMWSETIIVTLEDGSKAVVQFRAEPLDIAPFIRAQKLLGELVPDVKLLPDEELKDAGPWPVYLSYIEGHPWVNSKHFFDPKFSVTVMKSLGRVLARCVLGEPSGETLRNTILPKLDQLLQSDREEIKPFHSTIKALMKEAPACGIEKLPLFCSHMDLNAMNIMITDQGEITGLIDWELSPLPEPFGVGLHRIHDLIGEFRERVYYEREIFEDMERSFWSELLSSVPASWGSVIKSNLRGVEVGIAIGSLLFTFGSPEYINPAWLAALPKFLSYRIPALRGDDPPYETKSQ